MEFVNYELSKKLKEKGFKKECLCHYINNDIVYNIESPIANNQMWFCHNKFDNIWHRDNYDAPTISQVLEWLREEKNIFVDIRFNRYYQLYKYYVFTMSAECEDMYGEYPIDTYEQAVLAGIEYALDNLI